MARKKKVEEKEFEKQLEAILLKYQAFHQLCVLVVYLVQKQSNSFQLGNGQFLPTSKMGKKLLYFNC